jgi:hypothetical protein
MWHPHGIWVKLVSNYGKVFRRGILNLHDSTLNGGNGNQSAVPMLPDSGQESDCHSVAVSAEVACTVPTLLSESLTPGI